MLSQLLSFCWVMAAEMNVCFRAQNKLSEIISENCPRQKRRFCGGQRICPKMFHFLLLLKPGAEEKGIFFSFFKDLSNVLQHQMETANPTEPLSDIWHVSLKWHTRSSRQTTTTEIKQIRKHTSRVWGMQTKALLLLFWNKILTLLTMLWPCFFIPLLFFHPQGVLC